MLTSTPCAPESVVATARDGAIAVVELRRPPHNYFDQQMLAALADAFDALERDRSCRAIVLAAAGKSFCAGADFSQPRTEVRPGALYEQAVRLFAVGKPVVAAIEGAAIGGGLGLALVADFRVSCAQAKFSANFVKLGFHPGFGLSTTLPRIVGAQNAALLLLTGRRIDGDEALRIGLVDALAPRERVREQALALAHELAAAAPLAVRDTRQSLRATLVDDVRRACAHEASLQARHFASADCAEGLAAAQQRRAPVFTGA